MTSVEDFIHSGHAADAVRARVRPVLGHGSAFEVHGQAYTWVGWPAFLTLHAACVAFPVFVLRATTGLLRAPAKLQRRRVGAADTAAGGECANRIIISSRRELVVGRDSATARRSAS